MKTLDLDGVLFDLDGTLVDTAPDLLDAANRLRAELGESPMPSARLRPFVSKGGAAMVRAAFPDFPDAERTLLERFLGIYRERICALSTLFDGMAEVLLRLERARKPWGVVTNKPGYLTAPLLQALQLDRRAAVVVSGDTLPVRKPDPAPVLHACRALRCDPARVAMVGDDERDVLAARAAGAIPVLAGWGYFTAADRPQDWGAPHRVERPLDLTWLFRLGVPDAP